MCKSIQLRTHYPVQVDTNDVQRWAYSKHLRPNLLGWFYNLLPSL